MMKVESNVRKVRSHRANEPKPPDRSFRKRTKAQPKGEKPRDTTHTPLFLRRDWHLD